MELFSILLGFLGILGNALGHATLGRISAKPSLADLRPSIVPLPKKIEWVRDRPYLVVEKELKFKIYPASSDMIQYNIDRFMRNTFPTKPPPMAESQDQLNLVEVHIQDTDKNIASTVEEEWYTIEVGYSGIYINTKSPKGVVRALDTLMQLIIYFPQQQAYFIPRVIIEDEPRFPFRGFMLDSARHFLPVEEIKHFMDLAAIAKLNVFHWHIVDDEAFPYVSSTYPDLSRAGTKDKNKRYSYNDIQSIIQHASFLGIDVLPEFDTPGHTASWKGIPGFNTMCSNKYGPTDITREGNYEILQSLLKEVFDTFSSNILHIGGDEVSYDCWLSVKHIRDWMKTKNFTSGVQVQSYHTEKLIEILKEEWKYVAVWQEVYQSLSKKLDVERVIINVWYEKNYNQLTKQVVKDGYRVITGSCWYLNYIDTYESWKKWYDCDPHEGIGKEHLDLIMGGTISMWGEKVFPENLLQRSWMRAMVPAERLWSQRDVKDHANFTERLFDLYCRLQRLGYPVTDIEVSRECPYQTAKKSSSNVRRHSLKLSRN